MTYTAILKTCPFRTRLPTTEAGCCRWGDFVDSFVSEWAKRGDLPTEQQWRDADKDWRAGNTGWEAVQNAKWREREQREIEARKTLVCIGGNNYAEAGSALALKYGKAQP